MKFHECMVSMFGMGMSLWNFTVKIVIHVKFLGFRYVVASCQTEINSCNWAQKFRFEDGGIKVQ